MKRRQFIQSSVAVATSPLLISGCQNATKQQGNSKIKGFIFSDAHIGWKGKDQPTLDAQKSAINSIAKQFNDLDLVFDTGDVHHGNLKERERKVARDFWLKEMAGQFPTSLFHYIPGNHELGSDIQDAELSVGQLGSFVFRPYYSFDYKGIHFISLPQLQDTILISQESLNWLEIDLSLNKEKTTVVFSHNSLAGTTYNDNATGYRVTVNSQQVADILNEHNNVIAWFHGHNHQYEIVNKDKRLYVSNGRIGGFNPPESWGQFGQGHLGGVYFEIDANGLTVKCFSATQNDYFENLGLDNLSDQLSLKTSFNANSPVNYYWGHGMVHGNNAYQFNNHYLSMLASQASLVNNASLSINANHDFKYKTEFKITKGWYNKLIGYNILPKNIKYRKVAEGVEILPADNEEFFINLPIENYKFENYLSRSGYYRCGLGSNYLLNVECEHFDELKVDVQFKVLDKNHDVCYQSTQWMPGQERQNSTDFEIDVPESLSKKPQDHRLYLFVKVRFSHASKPVIVKGIKLLTNTLNNNKELEQISIENQLIDVNQNAKLVDLNGQSGFVKMQNVVAPKTLYIKTPKVMWQIRNATATLTATGLIIHNLRHQFLKQSQILIVPTSFQKFYVNELVNISGCQITYFENKVLIQSIESKPGAILTVVAKESPVDLKGVEPLHESKNRFSYKVIQDEVVMSFASNPS